MAEITPLTGTINAVPLAQGYSLTAPGLKGTARKIESGQKTTRSAAPVVHQKNLLQSAVGAEAMLFAQFELEVESDAHKGATDAVTRAGGITTRTSQGEAAMVFTSPKRANVASVVLYTDESGESRWIWPDASVADNQKNHFYLPRESAEIPKEGDKHTRGAITKGMRRIVNVLGWVTDELLQLGAVPFIKKWEEKHRPYGLHAVQPGSLSSDIPWGNLQKGRALLLIHGTFSTDQVAFEGLINSPVMQQLTDHYQGRVFSFNHPTLHHTPTDNIRQFLQMLPAEIKNLDLDVVTHSRGGLVCRELCERFGTFGATGKQINVHRAIFVAGPHNGTILADRDHWTQLIDSYTNLLTNLPDTPVTITMEALITLVKVVGGGTVHALPGLQSMLPGGEWLKGLNSAPKPGTAYYALAARYVPDDDRALVRFGKRLLMKALAQVFGEDSDMVVPTKGCYETNPNASGFPIPADRHLVYNAEADINHLNFFDNDDVNKQLLRWLSA